MRRQDTHPFFIWIGILLLVVLLAVLAGSSLVLRGETPPSPTPLPLPTALVSATPPGPLLSDSRGFIALPAKDKSAELRRETDAVPMTALRGQGFIGAVSGTGRRVAYWATASGITRELRVFDVTAPDQETSLATVLETERGAAAVWSADRTGVLAVVESGVRTGTAEQPTPFSALRVVDTPTRSVREIARVTDGSQYWPAGWDRVSRLVGACVYGSDGMAIAWAVVGEDALSARVPMEKGIPVITVRASGKDVVGVLNQSVVRVWTLASYTEHREFGAQAGERVWFARWKPGADDIVVLVADRLELWPKAGGDRKVVARGLPAAASDLLVSSDGALAFVTFESGRNATAVDLATGRTAAVPMSASQLLAPVSFR